MENVVVVQEPQTPEEWQQAVNLAHVLGLLSSARRYGMVEGGPDVNEDRCVEILQRGKQRGFEPDEDTIRDFFDQLVRHEADVLEAQG